MTDKRAKDLFSEAVRNVLAGNRAEGESFAEACRFYERAVTHLRTITERYASSKVASQLVRGELRIGPYTMRELSEEVVPRAKMRRRAERDPIFCALLLSEATDSTSVKDELLARMAIRHAREGEMESAMERVREIRQALTRTATLSRMATASAEKGNEDVARDFLAEALRISGGIRSGVFRDVMLSQVVEGCTSIGEYGKAFEVATDIGYMSVRARTVAKIAAGYVQHGLDDQALQLLSRITDEAEGRYARFVEVEDVEELDESSARLSGIPPEAAFTLRMLALDMGRFGEKELESSKKDEWSELVKQLPVDLPSGYADASSIRGFGLLAMWQENINEYSKAVTGIYTEIAKRYVEKGECERALELAGSVEDAYGKAILIAVALKLSEQGEIDRGTEVARGIDDVFYRTEALAGIAKQCVRGGRYRHIPGMLEMVDDPARKTQLLLETAEAYADAGKAGEAQRMLGHALSAAQMMEESFSRNWYFDKIAERYVASTEFEKAHNLLGEIEDPYTRAGVLLTIASGQLASRSRRAMSRTLDEALQIVGEIENAGLKAGVLTRIAFVMAKARRTEEAADILRRALDASRAAEAQYRRSMVAGKEGVGENEPDQAALMHAPFYDSAMESVAMGFAALGRHTEALRVILETPPGHRADALSLRLSVRYAEAGSYEKALGFVRMIDDTRFRAAALAEIGEKLSDKKQKLGRKAERILHEIVAKVTEAVNGGTG